MAPGESLCLHILLRAASAEGYVCIVEDGSFPVSPSAYTFTGARFVVVMKWIHG